MNERHFEIIKSIFNYALHTCKINSIMKLCNCINVTKNYIWIWNKFIELMNVMPLARLQSEQNPL
jgi:hypothetical protein